MATALDSVAVEPLGVISVRDPSCLWTSSGVFNPGTRTLGERQSGPRMSFRGPVKALNSELCVCVCAHVPGETGHCLHRFPKASVND